MKLPFALPAPAGNTCVPQYDGTNFILGDCITPVLEYSENFAGWSDDLTDLHESAAGDSHPLDLASRYDAIMQVSRALPSGLGVIMEVGCSSGFFITSLVNNFPKSVIIGVDVVKEPLYRLALVTPGVPLIRFDFLQCPLPDACIDILVMLNVLEHISDDIMALEKAFKLLKPGGSLIIEVPACQYLYNSYDAQLHHFRRYSASELQRKLEAVGFIVVRRSHLGFLLFPAFALVKLIHKILINSKSVVHKQAASTSNSILIGLAMKIETKLATLVRFPFPFGIRVLMTAKKRNKNC